MINLKFLGKGAAFYPVFGNTNAFFEKDGDLFFLDFGESAFEKAVRLLDLTAYRHVYVLITHLHADHAGSLASLVCPRLTPTATSRPTPPGATA